MFVRFFWACSALLLGLSYVSPARAWTSAHVRTLKAEIEPTADGRAQVTMTLGVDVQGGWLERLDVPGLDEELEVDAALGAWLMASDGSQVPATVRAKDGELSIRFERGSAPRRGQHLLAVRYGTVLLGRASESQGNGFVRLRHGLPGWEAGLTEGEVAWLLPAGARAVEDPGVAQELVREPASGGRVRLRFVRAHVPRSSPWSVAVDVPQGFFGSQQEGRTAHEARPSERKALTGGLLAAGLLLLSALSRAASRRQAAREGLAARPLGSARVRRGLRLLSVLAAALLWPLALPCAVLGLVALSLTFLDRCEAPACLPGLGRFVPLTRADLRRCRRTRLLSAGSEAAKVLLVCSALGLVLTRVPSAFAWAGDPWGLGIVCALVPIVMGSRLRRPRQVSEQVGRLAAVAGQLVTVGSALRLFWYVPSEGAPREPRLRVMPFARYPGLLRVELAIDTRRTAQELALMVVVEADSAADGWLAGEPFVVARELSPGGLRAVHLARVDDPTEDLDALFACLTRGSQGAWVAQLGPLTVAA